MRRCIAISATMLFLALASYARLSGEQRSGQELLQQVKQALRAPGKAWAGTMVSGKAVRGGVEHAYSFAFLPDGRFVQSFQGSNSKTLGSDGKRYWQEDYSHFVQELDLADRDRQRVISLLLSDNWLFGSAPIQLTAEERIVHVLLKETGVTVDLHLDPVTHLPTDASFQIPGGTTLKLSDWRVAGDRRIPMHVEVTTDGETETYSADVARPIRPGDVQSAMPKQNVSDFTFDPKKPAVVESSFAGEDPHHGSRSGQRPRCRVVPRGQRRRRHGDRQGCGGFAPSRTPQPRVGIGSWRHVRVECPRRRQVRDRTHDVAQCSFRGLRLLFLQQGTGPANRRNDRHANFSARSRGDELERTHR